MSPPPSHRARSSAGAAPARASDDASSSPSSPSRASAPGTPTRRRVVSGGVEFDPGSEFLPDLPLPEDADADAGERSSVDTEKRGEGAGLYASIPLERAGAPSSNSIFSNGPRSTPYDAAIPFHSLSPPRPSSPETPSSPTSPTRSGPPSGPPSGPLSSSGPPSADGREASAVGNAAGSLRRGGDGIRKEKGVSVARAKTAVKDAGVAGDGKDSLRRLFKLPESEVFVEEYLCALYKKILLQGRMYVFQNHVCFYSNVFGYTKVKTIALKDVTIVNRAYTAQVVFNAIEIVHKGKCEFFTSFIFPDRTYKTITRAWRACSRYAKIFADQKTLSGAHDAESATNGNEERRAEARSSPEVRAMLGEGGAAPPRTALAAGPEKDGPSGPSASPTGDAALRFRDEDVEETTEREARSSVARRNANTTRAGGLSERRAGSAFKAATVAGGGHGRRASAPALRLASSSVSARAPAGGEPEALDEPSVPETSPLSADESDEDEDQESFRVSPGRFASARASEAADAFPERDVASLPPLPRRPADAATLVESRVVECSVARFFALAWSDAAGETFTRTCAEERRHTDLRVTPWRAHRGYGHARDLTFVAPTNASIGPRETHCHQTQSYRAYRASSSRRRLNTDDEGVDSVDIDSDANDASVALVVDTSQVQKDIPYGDYFRVESRWEVRALSPRPDGGADGETAADERCEVWVGLRIPFQKTTMLRKVIERSALEESRQSAHGVLALVERRLAERESEAAAKAKAATRAPRHRRQRSFADAVAETVDVSKLLIPEGSQDVIWRMLFGSKEASSATASDDAPVKPRGEKNPEPAFVRDAAREADGGSADASRTKTTGASRRRRGLASALRAVGESSREADSEDDAGTHDATLGARGVDLVATLLARLAKTARAALASLLFRKILAAALVAWLAARVAGDETFLAFSAPGRFFSSAAEMLFSSRDSAVADVARWKRRAASLELELHALERRAAFVAGEAAHARAALAEAMDRTTSEPRSAVRGGFFSS